MLHQGMSLKIIETILHSKLENCELWADLKLTESEFNLLSEKIRAIISTHGNRYRTYQSVLSTYPVCAVTQIVFYVVYRYQDEFWAPWAEDLGLSTGQEENASIGNFVIAMFSRYHFKWDNDGYKYVTPIMCQAGIPYEHLDDLFDVVYFENSAAFDMQNLVKELTEWKSYFLHKSVLRFLIAYPGKAAEMLADIDDLIQSQTTNSSDEDSDDFLVKKYEEWKNHTSEKQRQRRREQEYPLPYLCFSDDGRGLCLAIPSLVAKNEYISSYKWVICSDDGAWKKEINLRLNRDSSQLYTTAKMLSVPPCDSFIVQLYTDLDSHPVLERAIAGMGHCPFILFDRKGHKVSDRFLPAKEAFIVYNPKICSVVTYECNYMERLLPQHCEQWRALMIAPENRKSCAIITTDSQTLQFRLRSSIYAELTEGDYLFHQRPYGGNLALYTALPQVKIWLDEGHTFSDITVRIRHRQSGEIISVDLTDTSSEKLIDLEHFFESSAYGVYTIRIYEKKDLRKNLIFALVPDVECSFHQLNPWPIRNSNAHLTGFEYKKSNKVSIEAADNVIQKSFWHENQEWISLTLDIPITEIRGNISFTYLDVSVTLPWVKQVRNFTWSIWKEGDLNISNCFELYTLTDLDLNDKYWLSFWMNRDYLAEPPKIKLLGRGKSEKQVIDAKLDRSGKFTIPIDLFDATLKEIALPADIKVAFSTVSGSTHEIYLAHISEAVLLPGINYMQDPHNSRFALVWQTSGKLPETDIAIKGISEPDFEETLPLNGLQKSPNGAYWIKYINFPIAPGLYKIEQAMDDDFFFDDSGYRPPKLQQENIFAIDIKTLQKNAQKYISVFLKFCIYQSKNPSRLKNLRELFAANHRAFINDIDEAVFKLMVCIIVNYADEADETSENMMQIIKLINDCCMDDSLRTHMLQWILSYNLTSLEKKTCIRILNLFLAKKTEDVNFSTMEIEAISHINPELGLKWSLRTNAGYNLYLKLNTIIGFDALRAMIRFHGTGNWKEQLRAFLDGTGKAPEIKLSKDLVGRSAQFQNMFEWGTGNELPHVNLSLRPETGIYFCGRTYCDLLIRWYITKRKKGLFDQNFKEQFHHSYAELDQLQQWIKNSHYAWATEIVHAAEYRKIDASKEGFFPLFYYCLLGAAVHTIADYGLIPKERCVETEKFLNQMTEIFPELLKRDLMMCQLLVFFDRGN